MKIDDLAKARILVTNDDGIHAPGLEALIEIANQLSTDVWVVAPEANQSGAGHSLSLSQPIRMREINETKFALEGTPTDCVLFAVKHPLLKEPQARSYPVRRQSRHQSRRRCHFYSGHLSLPPWKAACSAHSVYRLLDRLQPGLYPRSAGQMGDGDTQRRRCGKARAVVRLATQRPAWSMSISPTWSRDSVKGTEITHQGVRAFGGYIIERQDPRGGTYYWIAYAPGEHELEEGSDIAAVRSGHISVTPLHLDLTHEGNAQALALGIRGRRGRLADMASQARAHSPGLRAWRQAQ